MRFLIDQDVYHVTVCWLKDQGHNVVTAVELGLASSSDEELLKKAVETERIMVTRDKDFGALVFLNNIRETGVILLRINPATIKETHQEIHRLLEEHGENLKGLFCVVEPHRHRVRRLCVL